MEEDWYYNYGEGNATCPAAAVVTTTAAEAASAHHTTRRPAFQRFGAAAATAAATNNNANASTAATNSPHSPSAQLIVPVPVPTPPTMRGTRNPRRSSEERGIGATTAVTDSSTLSHLETAHNSMALVPTPPSSSSGAATPSIGESVHQQERRPSGSSSVNASSQHTPLTTITVATPAAAAGRGEGRAATGDSLVGVARRSKASDGAAAQATASAHAIATNASVARMRTHMAYQHGLAAQPILVAGDAEAPTPHPPPLRPVTIAQSAKAERRPATEGSARSGGGGVGGTMAPPPHARPSTAGITNAAAGGLGGSSGAAFPPPPPLAAAGTVVPLLDTAPVDLCDSSSNPSLTESMGGGLEGDVSDEVAEACHGFLQRLPAPWARPIVRALTLQTATLQIPPRLLRSPALFDAYSEMRGEVASVLDAAAAAAATTSTAAAFSKSGRALAMSNNNRGGAAAGRVEHTPFHSINLQHLLTVAPALLRHRLHNTRAAKVEELRAGFRSSAQTAARTEASVSRYAFLPHVQRDVHFGAVLAQGAPRYMRPGPQLTDGLPHHRSTDGSEGGSLLSHHHAAAGGGSRAAQTASPPSLAPPSSSCAATALTRTYSAVSFEGYPSIFLKDRYDIAQAESTATSGGGGGNYRNSTRRRRRITPFFDREFVATLAVGQEEAALFATTLAPELLLGMPSFLKHPEKAVPLSMAAILHHLYSALSVELYVRAYTAAALMRRAAGMEGGTADTTMAAAADAAAAAAAASTSGAGPNGLQRVSSGPNVAGNGTMPSSPSYPPSDTAPSASPSLRGPSLDVGMLYVRNTIVCNGCTPGMEAYLVFLNQLVYPEGRSDGSRRDDSTAAATRRSPPPPCRALVQLSEEANGSLAAPATPPSRVSGKDARPGAFDLPPMRHAAVEMTQLVTWVQDERSHDPRHGQPFLCHLTFVPTHIPDLAPPTLTRLCAALPQVEMEDANAFPCAAVLATVDLWKTLPPPEVSDLLRVLYILDRHAQRLMELESPDYGTEEEAAAAAAAAAASKARSSAEDMAGVAVAEKANPVSRAIAFPDPQVRSFVASAVAPHVRAYLAGLAVLHRPGERGADFQAARQQRLVSFFLTRLRYYEELNERHCKTEEALQREELERMARQRESTAAAAAAAQLSAPPTGSAEPTPSAGTAALPELEDAYEVRTKALGDALAIALALEAAAAHHHDHAASVSHPCHAGVQTARGGATGNDQKNSAAAAASPPPSWMQSTPLASYTSASDVAHTAELGSRGDVEAPAAPSIVVLLVPQRDVQRR